MARKSLMSIVFFTLYTSLFFLSQMWLDAILDDADFPRKNTQDNPKIATEDEDMEKVLEPLREVCVHFQAPRDEWWSYSWCHNSMVGQHHFDRETHKAVEHKTIGGCATNTFYLKYTHLTYYTLLAHYTHHNHDHHHITLTFHSHYTL